MKGVTHWEELHMERLTLGRSYALDYAPGGVMRWEELRIGRSYTLGEVTDLNLGGVTH